MKKYAMVLFDRVIDIVESKHEPSYPPDQEGNNIIAIECDDTVQIGDIYVDGKIIGTALVEPTQVDRIEENQLILMEAMATQYEESLENRLNDQEVQAIIYETLLEMGGN